MASNTDSDTELLARQTAALERIADALEAIQAQGKQNQHNIYRMANAAAADKAAGG